MTTFPARQFSRILVPIDFSAGSRRAWSVGQVLAAQLGAEVVLLHVLREAPLDPSPRLMEEERRAAVRSLQAEHQLGIPRGDEDDPSPPGVYEGPFTPEATEGFSELGRTRAGELEHWASAGRSSSVKVLTVLRVGIPYQEIIDAVRADAADVVLLGTHGHGGLHRLLLGSTADRVIRLAPCPVITVTGD